MHARLQSGFHSSRIHDRVVLYGRRAALRHASTTTNNVPRPPPRPLHVAVIGSGPAGFYATARLLQKIHDARVDMYEQLPTPFGLVRYGVAPDHSEVKVRLARDRESGDLISTTNPRLLQNCQDRFSQVASSTRFSFIGNVTIGKHLSLSQLQPHYDAILFAYGASKDKILGIPGEDLGGIYSARAFVGWYNGLPEYSHLDPDLSVGDEAVVIGNGNVALDVARILLSDPDRLRTTDIMDHAMAALRKSRVKHVTVIGRRGPSQAAFTIKEVRELLTLPGVHFDLRDPSLLPGPDYISSLPKLEQRKYRTAQLLRKGSASRDVSANGKVWSLQSMASPVSFEPKADEADPAVLGGLTLARTDFVDAQQRYDPAAKVQSTSERLHIPCSLAFRSIGYESTAMPGLASEMGINFDGKNGVLPDDAYGRVVEAPELPGLPRGKHIAGCYSAGWVKRGPTGVIASTMDDAFATADTIIQDWENRRPFLNSSSGGAEAGDGRDDVSGWSAVRNSDAARSLGKVVTWADWTLIDRAERDRGKVKGKERDKFRSVEEMLGVLD